MKKKVNYSAPLLKISALKIETVLDAKSLPKVTEEVDEEDVLVKERNGFYRSYSSDDNLWN